MSDIVDDSEAVRARAGGRPLFYRRVVFAAVVAATMIGLLWLLTVALSVGGLGATDIALIVMFAVTLPWTVIGFWNATIGLIIMRFCRDPIATVTPAVTRVRGDEPIVASTAILVCIRNEPPARVIRNLTPMIEGLVAAGYADRFHLYVLSDTSDHEIAGGEEAAFQALADLWRGRLAVTYRRRLVNEGYKAGNLRDFCERWGTHHELALTLDADSFIPAEAALRLVRVMQASPEIGILQGLVVGAPSTSAFARIFQFGMRLGMRSYTIGSAWWQGDCGPHWGHNSVLRLAPFIAHCHIPPLPEGGVLGGHVLSHDQIEAVLMRRAGYEVHALPEESLGWEENPPTLLEFIRRDLRWCQGNMQYLRFVVLPGLKPVSRYQLVFALLMFLGSPAWIGLLVLGTAAVALADTPAAFIRPDVGLVLLIVILIMWFAPKIATVIDVLSRPHLRRAFGGTGRFLASVAAETVFFLLLSPIMWFGHTVFLAELMLGRAIGWVGQARDDHAVPWSLAWRRLWPQTVLGLGCIAVLAASVPAAIAYALLIAAGLALAVPFAVLTAVPALGHVAVRAGLGRLPEETAPSAALRALGLPALQIAAPDRVPPAPESTQCSKA
jgi:membrane glycosyltransferase